jgi:hypothetical protein
MGRCDLFVSAVNPERLLILPEARASWTAWSTVLAMAGSLDPGATIKSYLIVRTEGTQQVRRTVQHYNLEAILAVGFRVRSHRGASDRRFYQKVLDIYATSIDYQLDTELSQQFFATVQNKMHWAAHGHTAAEIVHERADGEKPFMGMQTTRPGGVVRKADASIAKNYLTEPELQVLHRIVNLYIEFAELQALERKPMTMHDWVDKLDEFLKASGRKLLDHAGTISAEVRKAKAELEYERYQAQQDAKPRAIDAAFEATAKQLKKPGRARAKKGRGRG